MKTKSIILGMAIAALSAISLSQSNAQTPDLLAVKVVPTIQKDMIKVIYGYENQKSVQIKFMDSDGLIVKDKIKGDSFDKGFAKKYKVKRLKGDEFWIEITSPELSATYKMTANKNGKWIAQLEKATQYNVLASR